MTQKILVRRKYYGDKSWTAKSFESFTLNGKLARLEVETSKASDGRLSTSASVGFVTDSGSVITALYSDFYKLLDVSKTRCTEKAVFDQQSKAVANWGALKLEVINYYVEETL